MQEISLMNTRLCVCDIREGLDLLEDAVLSPKKQRAMIVNAACMNIAAQNDDYKKAVESYDIRFVDGVGIYIAGRILAGLKIPDLNGTDFGKKFMERCAGKGYSVYLLGAAPGIAEKAAENLKRWYPELIIAGCHHGYFPDEENSDIIDLINRTVPDVLIVCFGKPKEVIWIDRHIENLDVKLAIPLGGFLDFYSGKTPRAPAWMLKIRFEWLYRLFLEPGRLWKRYVIGNSVFMARVFRWKLTGK